MGQVSCVYGVVITEGNILRHAILRHMRKRRIAPARSGGAEPCPEGKPPQGVAPVTPVAPVTSVTQPDGPE